MVTRRDFLVAAGAASLLTGVGAGRLGQLAAQQQLNERSLLAFEPLGNVTLVHLTDIHGQLVPVHFREPSVNIGVGAARGRVPHITGEALRRRFNIAEKSAEAFALTPDDFVSLAANYGRMGGLDRIATIVKAIRAERGPNMLLLDGGDTWTNSWTALRTNGQDMVDAMAVLKPDAMTGHWEFTLGDARVRELTESLGFPFLAQNIRDSEFDDRVFPAQQVFERGGVKVAVIGQAFPFTPISNPRWMIPKWSFGIRESDLQKEVDLARAGGAGPVVLLSHNGFDVDVKVAEVVKGIDVILSGHTHDAVPEPTRVGRTLIIATGSNGKFVSRLDIDVQAGEIRAFRYRLIPVFADAINPDPEMASVIARHRTPHLKDLTRVMGRTETLLYRRGSFNGTFDDVICDALVTERDAEIALSPGFRWGTSLLPGADITFEDVTNATALSYPACYRTTMTGARLKHVLEDVADNIFNEDPFYQQGGDMVRTGGLGFTIDVAKPIGRRISELKLLRTGAALESSKEYVVSGWASVTEGVEGPPVWDVVARHIEARKVIAPRETGAVRVIGT